MNCMWTAGCYIECSVIIRTTPYHLDDVRPEEAKMLVKVITIFFFMLGNFADVLALSWWRFVRFFYWIISFFWHQVHKKALKGQSSLITGSHISWISVLFNIVWKEKLLGIIFTYTFKLQIRSLFHHDSFL